MRQSWLQGFTHFEGPIQTLRCRRVELDCVTKLKFQWFTVFFYRLCNGLLAWSQRDHAAGNDVTVEKSKAKTCRFVESKNRLSLTQIAALFLSVFVGCR